MKRPPNATGPRMLKRKDSPEFAWQTLQYVKTCYESKEITVARFTQALDEADEYRIYERIPPGYTSLNALLQAEIGRTRDQAIGDVKELKRNGGDRKSVLYHNTDLLPSPSQRGLSNEYLEARIARDHPDIYARLGEYASVHAAALAAGIIPKRISMANNVQSIARTLKRHLTADEIAELLNLL